MKWENELLKIFEILETLKIEQIINNYALIGSTALYYLLNKTNTITPNDIDIIVSYKNSWSTFIENLYRTIKINKISIKPYRTEDGLLFIINDIPFHFIWSNDIKLFEAAIKDHIQIEINSKNINIIGPEYLIVIMKYTNGDKYKKYLSLINEKMYNMKTLERILQNYNININ